MKHLFSITFILISLQVIGQENKVLIPFRKGEKFGYINQKGKVIVPYKFDDAGIFNDGMAWIKKNGRYGYINTKGKIVIRPKYISAGNFSNGYAEVKKKTGKSITISHKGRSSKLIGGWCGTGMVYLERDTSNIDFFKKNGKYGIYNTENLDTIISPKYDSAYKVLGANGIIHVSGNGLWGVVYYGFETVPLKYEEVGTFIDIYGPPITATNITYCILNGKIGWIDNYGVELIKPQFEDSDMYFFNGFVRVLCNEKWGYIDESGKRYFQD